MMMSGQIRSTWKDANVRFCIITRRGLLFVLHTLLIQSTQAATDLVASSQWHSSQWRSSDMFSFVFAVCDVCCALRAHAFCRFHLFVSHSRRQSHWVVADVCRQSAKVSYILQSSLETACNPIVVKTNGMKGRSWVCLAVWKGYGLCWVCGGHLGWVM